MKLASLLPISLLLFTSCIALPVLEEKYEQVAVEISYYLCQAHQTGADLESVTLEDLERIMGRFQEHGTRQPGLSNADIQTRIQEASEDPIQLGLLLQRISAWKETCTVNPEIVQ